MNLTWTIPPRSQKQKRGHSRYEKSVVEGDNCKAFHSLFMGSTRGDDASFFNFEFFLDKPRALVPCRILCDAVKINHLMDGTDSSSVLSSSRC